MMRPTFSKLALSSALATSMVLGGAGCQTPKAEAEPEVLPVQVEADDSKIDVVFEAVPAEGSTDDTPAEPKGEGKLVAPPNEELDDYYREDSRENIKAMESQLKPLATVQPKKTAFD